MVQVVQESHFIFSSDVHRPKKKYSLRTSNDGEEKRKEEPEIDDKNIHTSGILHSLRSSHTASQDQCFAWITDVTKGLEPALAHLTLCGFDKCNVKFIPYSSKKKWIKKYPHALPFMDSDKHGRLSFQVELHPNASLVAVSGDVDEDFKAELAARQKKTKLRMGPKLISSGVLSDDERDELHCQIFKYLVWLRKEIAILETTYAGRSMVKKFGISRASLPDLISKVKSTLNVQCNEDLIKPGAKSPVEDFSETPVLETMLVGKLNQMAKDSQSKKKRPVTSEDLQKQSFDSLYQKLVAFHAEHGHSIAQKRHDQELGYWISRIRQKKRNLENQGKMFESDEDKNRVQDYVYLSQHRIALLEQIGFVWSFARETSTWEETFEKLKIFKEENGHCNVPRKHELGEWVHCQRKLWSKKDSNFMAKRAKQLEEIGFEFQRKRYNGGKTWEERVRQLQTFKLLNGHFNVPKPENYMVAHGDPAALEFYTWFERVQAEYVSYRNGRPRGYLTEERLQQLIAMGVELREPKYNRVDEVKVADVPWDTRIEQLHSYRAEMGHLNICASYRLFGNLGGWALEMSTMYRDWREGRVHCSPEMIANFEQLAEIGFEFNVFKEESNRTWDDNFKKLLEYKSIMGDTRIPTKFKSDTKLGKWAFVQRKEYEKLHRGVPSKLTQERLEKLNDVGFDWIGVKPRSRKSE